MSDANSDATSNNGNNEHADIDEDDYENNQNQDQGGNTEIIKTINDIFQEVSDQIMDDANTRLRYIEKVNPTNKGANDAHLIDEVGIQDW